MSNNHSSSASAPVHYLRAKAQRAPQYEYRIITLTPQLSRDQAHSLITLEADTGKWELARTVVYQGGTTRYWLRRRVIFVHS